MQNTTRVMGGSWSLPSRFQRKGWEDRQCVAGLVSLEGTHEKAICRAVRVKPKPQWRPHNVGNTRNIEHFLPRKATGNEYRQPRRDNVGCNKKSQMPKLMGTHIMIPCGPDAVGVRR
jgi:hypothetical protein